MTTSLIASRRTLVPDYALAVGLAWLVLLPLIALRAFWFPDEPDVFEPVRGMLISGDWLVPRRNGVPWLDYPPLTYWCAAASCWLFGPSAFAARLPVVLWAGLLLGTVVWFAGRSAPQHRARPALAGVLLLTLAFFAWQAQNLHVDMAFAATQGVAVLVYLRSWQQQGRSAWGLRLLAALGFGLAILAKGPIGLLLPGLVLTVWHCWRRHWLGLPVLALVGLLALLPAAGWYAGLVDRLGGDYVWRTWYDQNFARFSGASPSHVKPWWYYLERIWADWLPWSLAVPVAVWAGWRQRQDPDRLAMLLWLGISIAFLSITSSKREVYLLPAYPAVALLLWYWLPSAGERRLDRRLLAAVAWLLIGLGGVLLLAGASAPFWAEALRPPGDQIAGSVWPVALVGSGIFLTTGLLALRQGSGRPVRFAWHLGLGFAASLLIVGGGALPVIDQSKTYEPHHQAIGRLLGPGGELGYFRPGMGQKQAGFTVYSDRLKAVATLDDEDALADHLRDPANVAVLRVGRDWQPRIDTDDWTERYRFRAGSARYLVIGQAP